jgi:hypothetical protein
MLRTISAIGIVLSLILLAAVPAQAADLETKVSRHVVKTSRHALAVGAMPQPICSWVGPGGRAIYRCR